jgi:hypothetical protein
MLFPRTCNITQNKEILDAAGGPLPLAKHFCTHMRIARPFLEVQPPPRRVDAPPPSR